MATPIINIILMYIIHTNTVQIYHKHFIYRPKTCLYFRQLKFFVLRTQRTQINQANVPDSSKYCSVTSCQSL